MEPREWYPDYRKCTSGISSLWIQSLLMLKSPNVVDWTWLNGYCFWLKNPINFCRRPQWKNPPFCNAGHRRCPRPLQVCVVKPLFDTLQHRCLARTACSIKIGQPMKSFNFKKKRVGTWKCRKNTKFHKFVHHDFPLYIWWTNENPFPIFRPI